MADTCTLAHIQSMDTLEPSPVFSFMSPMYFIEMSVANSRCHIGAVGSHGVVFSFTLVFPGSPPCLLVGADGVMGPMVGWGGTVCVLALTGVVSLTTPPDHSQTGAVSSPPLRAPGPCWGCHRRSAPALPRRMTGGWLADTVLSQLNTGNLMKRRRWGRRLRKGVWVNVAMATSVQS